MRKFLLIPFFLMLNTGCSLLEKAIDPPKVEFQQARVEDVGLTKATVLFDLKILNPNPIDIKVDSVDYKLRLNDKDVAEGIVNKTTVLPAQKSAALSIPVEVEYRRFMDSLLSALQKPDANYLIQGKARIGPFSVPFERKGILKFNE